MTAPRLPLLLVDDEASVLESMSLMLRSRGFRDTVCCASGVEALRVLDEQAIGVVLLDLVMPGMRGEEVLRRAIARDPEVQVIVVTAQQSLQAGVTCMQLGASDYLTKPVDVDRLVASIRRAQARRASRGGARAPSDPPWPRALASIITRSPKMFRIFRYVQAIAPGDQAVFVTGETGTGKELVARAIHDLSGRDGAFVAVNTAGLDDTMFSDTLFGHGAGAFTGAIQKRRGLIEKAGAGTLFLDEIGSLSEVSQLKLLRLLQEYEYSAIGSDVTDKLHARVIAATHEPSRLRQDLLYRLRGYQVALPPLRERADDIALLVTHFAKSACADLGLPVPMVPDDIVNALCGYSYPGNVRELRAMVFHAVADRNDGALELSSFLSQMAVAPGQITAHGCDSPSSNDPLPTLEQMQRDLVAAALRRTGGDRQRAAALLGVTESQLDFSRSEAEILTVTGLRELEKRNMLRALHRAKWRVSGPAGAAALLGLKPSTLASRMKALGIRRNS